MEQDRQAVIPEEETPKLTCPGCSTTLNGSETECPNCGRALDGKLGLRCPLCGTPIDKSLSACPICGISIEKILPKTTGGPAPTVVAGTRPCPICEAVIPEGLARCPLCKNDIREVQPRLAEEPQPPPPSEPQPEQVEQAEQVSEPEPPPLAEPEAQEPPVEEDAGKVTAPAAPATKVVRRRVLKAKVTTVPAVSQPGLRGLTNGVGRVNGTGKVNGTGRVNGTGAVNGRAFVNGTGTPVTAEPRPTKGAGKRIAVRWQLMVVLIAILIVVPTFMYLTFSDKGSKYSIDGNFDEWVGAKTYGSRIPSAASSNNITSWIVVTEETFAYLYVQTETAMMNSPEAESLYLFIDSDGASMTGYAMESIGADYLVQLSGWNATVQSAALLVFSSSDRYDWSGWSQSGSASAKVVLTQLEARTALPVALTDRSQFVLISKDSSERGAVSYTVPLSGGALSIQQSVAAGAETGIIPRADSAPLLTLTFTCDGEGGQVTQVTPESFEVPVATHIDQFSLSKGEKRTFTVALNTSAAADGQFVSARIAATGVASSFKSVEIIGTGAAAYVDASSTFIRIDGAFADWQGRISLDSDPKPVASPSVDIDGVGNFSNAEDSFFYVSVEGKLCSGAFVPTLVARPTSAGGGSVIPSRHSAEDILTISIDCDKSDSTGDVMTLGSNTIGADQRIEVKGLYGKITSMKMSSYSPLSDRWVDTTNEVDAAKDDRRIEIGVTAASLGGSANIDFIVETTSWRGLEDRAIFDASSMASGTRTWIVEPSVTSPYATSMSYQRKMFYDGVNHWSFYFNGMNTVYKYSTDLGQSWTLGGRAFTTPGVNETSVWYDSSTTMVYAVGDTATASTNVSVQAGVVDPIAHTITWLAADSNATVSANPLAGKNTYISKDANGYLWILSSNLVVTAPAAYQLSAYVSTVANSTLSWTFSGNMLAAAYTEDNLKGSIVPAGTGSDMWAVYGYGGNVAASKYDGAWQLQQIIYTMAGGKGNTDNSPPSVVVDGKGVVHVVYGNSRRIASAKVSIPMILHSYNLTGLTTFSAGVEVDPLLPAGIGDYFPTLTLDTSTGILHAMWLRGNETYVPTTVMSAIYASGTWSYVSIPVDNSFPKMFLTSIYSVPDESKLCWQWTENKTAPISVLFDGTAIPEFSDLVLPVFGVATLFIALRRVSRRKDNRAA